MKIKMLFRFLFLTILGAAPVHAEMLYRASEHPTLLMTLTRPFRGQIVGNFASTPTADPVIFRSRAEAEGHGTQIGRFSKVTDDLLNTATGEVTGTFTMTTATGELLHGNYAGRVVPDGTTFRWVLDANITGGTGKFKDAAGKFVFRANGEYRFVDGGIRGKYTETFDGSITY